MSIVEVIILIMFFVISYFLLEFATVGALKNLVQQEMKYVYNIVIIVLSFSLSLSLSLSLPLLFLGGRDCLYLMIILSSH